MTCRGMAGVLESGKGMLKGVAELGLQFNIVRPFALDCTFFALSLHSNMCDRQAHSSPSPPNALHGRISPHSMSFVSRGLTDSNTSSDRVCVFCRTARRGPSSSSLGSTCSPTLRRHSTRWARNGVLTDVDATRSDDVDATITVPITSDIASPRFREIASVNVASAISLVRDPTTWTII